ncbi:uncharacterized protein LOC135499935 [Lineus longissimus]|uniref:uncharacterized protein LOC135499935 n=1 Tax=Lineus longissimus TaxID=88925 RepID=UPI00315D73B9
MWRAIPLVFGNIHIMGCSFHWAQCLWRKIQEIGLSPAYKNDNDTHKLLRQFMALPYLPHAHIQPMFEKLVRKANTPALQEFTDYVRRTWIANELWSPRTWSIFMEPVRTNNDVEGWHGMLNRHAAKSNLEFYKMTRLLQEQASLIEMQVRFISDAKLERRQRKVYRQQQGKIFTLWDEFIQEKKTATQLLRKCSHLVASNTDN